MYYNVTFKVLCRFNNEQKASVDLLRNVVSKTTYILSNVFRLIAKFSRCIFEQSQYIFAFLNLKSTSWSMRAFPVEIKMQWLICLDMSKNRFQKSLRLYLFIDQTNLFIYLGIF